MLVARIDLYSLPGFYDPVSALTHLLAAPLFLVLSFFLLRRGRGDNQRLVFLGIYAFSCVFLLSMSGVYHMMVMPGTARRVMERLDHSAIFVLIAGTFTAVHGILFQGWPRWTLLIFVWASAIAGLTLKIIFFSGWPEWVGLAFFLGLGWCGVFSFVALWRRYGYPFVRLLLWGGIAYTVGALLEFFGWMIVIRGVVGPHELFHLAVLAGIACHWAFVWRIAAGRARIDKRHSLPRAYPCRKQLAENL